MVLRTQIVRPLNSSFTVSEASLDTRSESGDLMREYKKLMAFSQQQAQDKSDLERQLSMLRLEYSQREEKEAKRLNPGQPLYSQTHVILVIVLGVIVGSLLFRSA